MTDDKNALQSARDLGLLEEEYNKIKEVLGRVPNFTELSIYSVMWSEHCSYKNSITYLKKLPRKGKHLLVEAGEENAGLVDLGDGLACCFKIESHNHPSALEPYQGAATGVGGIHRDIFTMGARPIAALNSLRFGDLSSDKTKQLLRGVVKGIGDYGNCFGVPTVAGEVYFDSVYETNPLVNAMSVGIVKTNETISATSKGAGNPVFIVGSATGKDGIAGAAFASKDISEDSINDLPAVQVGDPFMEKLLLEASLELIKSGAVVGMQDMGAAGITCSTSEMSAKGKHGMNVWLDRVPTRQTGMKPWEILLSESQERMLVVVHKGKEDIVKQIFDKWDLHCTQIAEVTEGEILNYYFNDELVASVPAESLVLGGGAPVYNREYKEPAYFAELKNFSLDTIPDLSVSDLEETARQLIGLPNIAGKRWVYRQYDSMVGIANTRVNEPSDAAIVRVADSEKCLALTVDCNARYIKADPYVGGMMAVSEAARNIVCSGGSPSAITNCLNFGNPYKPEVYWQFVNALKGMGDACLEFDTPVTGGNVSFYNQSAEGGAVYPTPTIGMLGVLGNIEEAMTLAFQKSGDLIYLIGEPKDDLGCSEYLFNVKGVKESNCPYFDLKTESTLQQCIAAVIRKKIVSSAHDISEGGLFACLLESAMPKALGFEIHTDDNYRLDAYLFGETASRVVVSIDEHKRSELEAELKRCNQPFALVGKVTDGLLLVNYINLGNVQSWKKTYDTSIEQQLSDALSE